MVLKVLSHTNDGTVNVLINEVEYVYFIDSIWIEPFLKMAKKRGGDALNFLKRRSRFCNKVN
jgi:hypothetical protein